MRRAALIPIAASALLIAVAPVLSQPRPQPPGPPGRSSADRNSRAQPPAPQPQAPAKPYNPVAITAPKPIADPSFEAFRKQIGAIAERKDRDALAEMVSQEFLLDGREGRPAPTRRSPASKISRTRSGSTPRTARAGRRSPALPPIRPACRCRTARTRSARRPNRCSTIKQLETLAKATGTEEGDWGYPTQPGLEVRAAPQPNAPVVEKLGMHFVRVMDDDGAGAASRQIRCIKVVAPSGKVGFVPADAISPLGNDQICYAKEAPAAGRSRASSAATVSRHQSKM